MNTAEKLHAGSHIVLFLMLFMITLAVMKFSSPTGLAAGNHTMQANGVGDFKPFLTAVGLLMAMLMIALVTAGTSRLIKHRQESAPAEAQPQRSLEDINRQLAELRRKLR
jgi:hypothetical protein